MFLQCKKNILCKDDNLSLQKTTYTGDQLKIDGYFYGEPNSKNNVRIYYLYSNGVFFDDGIESLEDSQNGTIKVDVSNNLGKQTKGQWGTFSINGNSIEIERWQSNINGCETTIYEKGNIINDTSFVITRREFRERGKSIKTEDPNSTFYFKALPQKPDSTNVFVP